MHRRQRIFLQRWRLWIAPSREWRSGPSTLPIVQRALNRGEAYHQLRRAVSSVNGDQFRGSSDEEIQLWNECARLVTNAIIYFNSSILSQLLTSFEYQNDDKRIQIVKQASPVAWYNINLKGIYTFEMSEKLPDLEELMRTIEGYLPVREK